jgi:transposase
VDTDRDNLANDIGALKAALVAERDRRIVAEAAAAIAQAKLSDDQALIAHLKLQIEKLKRELYGPRSERTARLLDQLELQLEELETAATEDEIAAERAAAKTAANVTAFTRKRPTRKPFPEHLPRERVVIAAPASCACCGGLRLSKLGEDVTETLESIPRQWKVIQYVREKFSCRDCESISQTPAPFHVIARGWAGPSLLAMIVFEKFGQHQPLNRQAERYAREGVPLSLSTLADQVGACANVLRPIYDRLQAHVLAAERLHGDDTTVPVLAKGKTDIARSWVYVRDDAPFGGRAPPAAVFYYSRDRSGEHPQRHLSGFAGILQADAYGGYGKLYEPGRIPGPIVEAACWSHGRRKFFVLADIEASAQRKARGKKPLCSRRSRWRRRSASTRCSRSSAPSMASAPISAKPCDRTRARRSSPVCTHGCANNAPSSRAITIWPRRWITCSSAGTPSRGSSTTAASASATMPPKERCAALRLEESRGCSPAPIAAASGRR